MLKEIIKLGLFCFSIASNQIMLTSDLSTEESAHIAAPKPTHKARARRLGRLEELKISQDAANDGDDEWSEVESPALKLLASSVLTLRIWEALELDKDKKKAEVTPPVAPPNTPSGPPNTPANLRSRATEE